MTERTYHALDVPLLTDPLTALDLVQGRSAYRPPLARWRCTATAAGGGTMSSDRGTG